MAVKYVDEFDFGPAKTHVRGYCRGGPAKKYAEGGAVKATRKAELPAQPMRGGKVGSAQPAMPPGRKVDVMRDPGVRRAAAKSVPVAPAAPLLAMKAGGMAKMRKC